MSHLHVASKEPVTVPALVLGFIHRGVRLTHQGFRVLSIVGVGASPNTDVDIEASTIDDMWRRDRSQDLTRDKVCVSGMLNLREKYYELVSAQPAYRVRPPDTSH
jgi:hypothetical protein